MKLNFSALIVRPGAIAAGIVGARIAAPHLNKLPRPEIAVPLGLTVAGYALDHTSSPLLRGVGQGMAAVALLGLASRFLPLPA